jgi:hypothetical protein
MPHKNVEENFLTKVKFSKMVEESVVSLKMSYMDTILHLCEEHGIEIEDVKKYLSNVIKNKLEAEAMGLNYLSKGNSLPFDEC